MTYYVTFAVLTVYGAMGGFLNMVRADHHEATKRMLLFVGAAVLVAIAGTRAAGIDRDYWNYEVAHICFSWDLEGCRMEPAFAAFSYLSDWAGFGIEGVIFLYALATIAIYAVLIARSATPYLSLLTFFSVNFMVHEMTQIRAGLAIAIGLWALEYLYRRQRLKFVATVAVAALAHVSALALLVLLFMNPKQHRPWLGVLLIAGAIWMSFDNHLEPLIGWLFETLFDVESKYVYYVTEAVGDVNRFGFIKTALIATYVFAAFNVRRIEPNVPQIHVYLNAMLLGILSFYVFLWLPGAPIRLLELFDAPLIFVLPAALFAFRGILTRGLAILGVLAFCFLHILFYLEIEKLVGDYRSVLF